jgi:hypothetical protein
MNKQKTTHDMHTQHTLEDIKVNLKLKLAALWASLMFLIIYLDYFHVYMPNMIDEIRTGIVFEFDITQGFLLIALIVVTIPALMIFLSVALPATINRRVNIIIAAMNIPCILFNLAGVAWAHMYVGAAVQVVLLCLIIRYAWKWPRVEI